MNTTEKLVSMFEADRQAEDYSERFPMYSYIHREIGCKPWHPPAEDVWQHQGEPADYDNPKDVAEVWQILSNLYREYQEA